VSGFIGNRAPGLYRIPREVVTNHQRQRMLTAAVEVVAEHGYPSLSVQQFVERAGVSRSTFYEHFDNKHDCVLAAHKAAFEQLTSAISDDCATGGDWPADVSAAVGAGLAFAADCPGQARLLIVSGAAVADPRLSRRAQVVEDHFVKLLGAGRLSQAAVSSLPEATERALVGAVSSVVGAELLAGRHDLLPELKPELVQIILTPYLGADKAARIATQRRDSPKPAPERGGSIV
jgi:AcrR family transcriptional regulator